MKDRGDLKEQEKGGEEEDETQKQFPVNELNAACWDFCGSSVEALVMHNTKDFPVENKGSPHEQQSRRGGKNQTGDLHGSY